MNTWPGFSLTHKILRFDAFLQRMTPKITLLCAIYDAFITCHIKNPAKNFKIIDLTHRYYFTFIFWKWHILMVLPLLKLEMQSSFLRKPIVIADYFSKPIEVKHCLITLGLYRWFQFVRDLESSWIKSLGFLFIVVKIGHVRQTNWKICVHCHVYSWINCPLCRGVSSSHCSPVRLFLPLAMIRRENLMITLY